MGRAVRKPSRSLEPDQFTLESVPMADSVGVVKRKRVVSDKPKKLRPELIKGLMLPLPPSANAYWRTRITKLKYPTPKQYMMSGGYTAMTYVSKDGKAYKEAVKDRIQGKGLAFMSEAPLRLDILVCMATNGRADISNRIKVLEDALQDAGVFLDDCKVVELHVHRGPVIKGGRVIISVTEVIPDPHGAMERSGWNG